MTVADAADKHQVEADRIKKMFEENLDVDASIAHELVTAGYTSVESLAFTGNDELLKLDGIDIDIVTELKNRASDYLLIALNAPSSVSSHSELSISGLLLHWTRYFLPDMLLFVAEYLIKSSADSMSPLLST